MSAPAGATSTSFTATISNTTNVAVSVKITASGGSYTITRSTPWTQAYGVLFGHRTMTIRGALPTAGGQLVITCNAGDGKAILVNGVLRPIVAALAPASLDDLDAILELQRGYDWSPAEHWGLGQLAENAGSVIKMVYRWSRSSAGKAWIAKHAARINLAVKLASWSADEVKTLSSYATFALGHGQRSIVVFSAAAQ